MRISIDIDGIVAKFTGQNGLIQPIANRLWPGIMPDGYQPPDWDHTDIFTKQHWNKIWEVVRGTPNFWYTAEPYTDNLCALRDFLSLDVDGRTDVSFVTSRASTAGLPVAKQTFEWFLDNDVPIIGIRGYSPVVLVPNSKNKRQVIEGLEIRYSIDDLGPTVEMCNQIPGHTAFVLDRPWNRDKEYGPRVFSLQEFFDKVEAN